MIRADGGDEAQWFQGRVRKWRWRPLQGAKRLRSPPFCALSSITKIKVLSLNGLLAIFSMTNAVASSASAIWVSTLLTSHLAVAKLLT